MMIRSKNGHYLPLVRLQCQSGLLQYKDKHISDSFGIIKDLTQGQYQDKGQVFRWKVSGVFSKVKINVRKEIHVCLLLK